MVVAKNSNVLALSVKVIVLDSPGCVQSMDVLRLLKKSGIQPKRTIRVVLFMNEENGLRGGNAYAKEATQKGENHVFALESDSGGFTPRGFTFDGPDYKVDQILYTPRRNIFGYGVKRQFGTNLYPSFLLSFQKGLR